MYTIERSDMSTSALKQYGAIYVTINSRWAETFTVIIELPLLPLLNITHKLHINNMTLYCWNNANPSNSFPKLSKYLYKKSIMMVYWMVSYFWLRHLSKIHLPSQVLKDIYNISIFLINIFLFFNFIRS